MNEQAAMMKQQQQQLMNMNQNMIGMNQLNPHQQPQPQMAPMNRSYGLWPPPSQFHNPNPGAMQPLHSNFNKTLGPRNNWKGKRVDKRRKEQQKPLMTGSNAGGIGGGGNTISGGGVGGSNFNNYKPPTLNELQYQNQLKTWKFFPKKKYNKNVGGTNNNNKSRSAPFAPRNTTSFLIRAKKSGGIASLVSPCPVTPAVLPTPTFSPSREVLVDMAKEEWGVDGYGSMKGLIRLRSPGHEIEAHEDEDEDEGCSSESDVEEHVEVERRLDHDLSRFEMIYNPNSVGGMEYHNVLENRVDDQDTHIAQLEEENLILKERLFLMERELGDLRRRMRRLEWRGNRGNEINEEVVENESENENENESHGDEAHSMEDNDEDFSEDNVQGDGCFTGKGDHHSATGFEVAAGTETISTGEFSVANKTDKYFTAAQGTEAEIRDENMAVHEEVKGHENETNSNGEFSEANKTDKYFAAAQGTEAENKDENMVVHEEVEGHENVNDESSDRSEPDAYMENDGSCKR
ncbi:WD repeat-containing protein 24 [Dorcoceras hygrometricum]|uniref:WD repeat-containing protein 24 n=1 Tax=Dorcoceras hygrometricum TaxID=472368 RepID=A0A2Z7B7C0_9LAMI|nr:WD repeat-containing protein 24 [Dorcoceras hygrometricum]